MNLDFVSLGCHNLTAGSSRLRSQRVISSALELGVRRFDVAPSYGLGTAERMLGDALGPRRNDPAIEITTKFGLLPEPHGEIKAWLREPYRWAKRLAGRRATSTNGQQRGAAAPSGSVMRIDPLGPQQAAERSLRALRVDRLGAFLTHEHVPPARHAYVLEGLARLQTQQIIARSGFSGELENVQAMLDANGGTANVAQVSVLDLAGLPAVGEARGFNLSRIAQRLLDSEALRLSLVDTFGDVNFGRALSASLAWAHAAFPRAVFLVNASTSTHLSALLVPVMEGRLSEWTAHNAGRMAAVAARVTDQ